MASTATPYGLRPIGTLASSPYTGGNIREYYLPSDNSIAIYTGGLVNITAGVPNGVSTAPAAGTLNGNTPIGVCVGVRYTDPTMKYSLFGQYLPVNAVTAGYTNVFVRVVDDPFALFQVQANTAVDRTKIGYNANLITLTGSATTGLSNIVIGSINTTNTLPVRIVDIVNNSSTFQGGLSVVNDAYTDCIVMWNNGGTTGTHAYFLATGQ